MFEQLLPDKFVERRYVAAGAEFGDDLSYGYMGEPVGFEQKCLRWEKWEKEYARRGYHTISLECFIDYGGYGVPLSGLGQRRGVGEQAIFHAQIYRALCRGDTERVPVGSDQLRALEAMRKFRLSLAAMLRTKPKREKAD